MTAPTAAPTAAQVAKRSRKVRWGARLGYWLVRALGATWRLDVRHDDSWPRVDGRRRTVVLACWHGDMLPCIWSQRHEGIMALASEHGDAEIVARIIERLGFAPSARGSSTRGGVRGLMTLVKALREGRSVAFTPDGPRGPARRAQPGVLVAARRAETVIVPVAMHASRLWRAGSWDRFAVPKPFARVHVAFGEPFTPREDGDGLAAGEVERFEAAMAAAERRASA